VRKVAGEVNPADLFTKHLPSKDKIHQLTALFGCEYREGRAASAPLLRPNAVEGQQDGHLPDDEPLPNFVVSEAVPHDPKVLPHMHCDEDIDKLFPKIEAAPEVANTHDWIPEADAEAEREFQVRGVMREERGHVRAARRGGEHELTSSRIRRQHQYREHELTSS